MGDVVAERHGPTAVVTLNRPDALNALFQSVAEPFGDMVKVTDTGFRITPEGRPLTRIIARGFDAYDLSKAGHSSAI